MVTGLRLDPVRNGQICADQYQAIVTHLIHQFVRVRNDSRSVVMTVIEKHSEAASASIAMGMAVVDCMIIITIAGGSTTMAVIVTTRSTLALCDGRRSVTEANPRPTTIAMVSRMIGVMTIPINCVTNQRKSRHGKGALSALIYLLNMWKELDSIVKYTIT